MYFRDTFESIPWVSIEEFHGKSKNSESDKNSTTNQNVPPEIAALVENCEMVSSKIYKINNYMVTKWLCKLRCDSLINENDFGVV